MQRLPPILYLYHVGQVDLVTYRCQHGLGQNEKYANATQWVYLKAYRFSGDSNCLQFIRVYLDPDWTEFSFS